MNSTDFKVRWLKAAANLGIATDNCNADLRVVMSEEQGKLPILVYNNPYKATRPPAPETTKDSCVLDREIKRAEEKGDNVILWVGEYAATPNLFPGVLGHSLYIHKTHSAEVYTVDKDDLEAMIFASNIVGHEAYCNLHGSGATQPYHKHFHSLPISTPADKLMPKRISEGIEHLVEFPYENLVFTGVHSADNAAKFVSDYKGIVAIAVQQYRIIVVPFKEFSGKGFGATEALGLFFVGEEEFKEGYEHFESRMASKLFKKGELGLALK